MENVHNVEQNNPLNCVLNNMVDKDVQLMLWPINLMQFCSLTPTYRIKNNYITSNSFVFNLFSLVGAIIFISLHIFRTWMLLRYKEHLGFTTFMTVTAIIDCIYYCFGFALNFVIGIIQIKNNVRLVLIFQRVHRFLNNETRFNHFIIWNCIMVIMVLICYFTVVSYITIQLSLPWYYLYLIYLLVVFDLNVVYAIQVIKLLQNKLELWNVKVLNSLEMEETHLDNFCKRMFQAYADILECHCVYKVYFQPFILYYIIEVFLHSLSYIQVTIDVYKMGLNKNNNAYAATLGMLSLFSWLSKNLTWQTMFMQRCETFYLAVQSVRDTCAVILHSNCSDDMRKLCKNVLRLHRASFSKMRVCGLFYADVAFQLSLMALLANYTVVLLQFAIL